MRVFGNLERLVPASQTWAKGMRMSMEVSNLLKSRPSVRLRADGSTPLSYQPAYLEPLGRTIRLSLRKQFLIMPLSRPA